MRHPKYSRACFASGFLLSGALLGGGAGAADELQVKSADTGAERINEAIDRGIEYLLAAIEKQPVPTWKEDPGRRAPGQVALETYALVVAGVSVEHPLIKRSFEYLEAHLLQTGYTYGISCYAFALDAAIAQLESDALLQVMDLTKDLSKIDFRDNPAIGREFRTQLATAIHRLVSAQKPFGGWIYNPDGSGPGFDNSNTQFAVLALGVGQKRNVPIEPIVWERIVDHFIKGQDQKKEEEVKDRLTPMAEKEVTDRKLRGRKQKEKVEVDVVAKGPETQKDKKAGAGGKDKEGEKKPVTGVKVETKVIEGPPPPVPVIGTEHIPVYRRGWRYGGDLKQAATWNMTCAGLSSLLLAREALKGRLSPAQQESLNAAIRDGFGWLMTNWSPMGSFYGIYSLEKVADIGEVKKFGAHDWYAEATSDLLGSQHEDGSWGSGEHGSDARLTTAFALLVLNRATALVMMSLMSQSPIAKIMVSGKRSNLTDPTDRSWIYVPKLDTTLHYPTLLRAIRLRSHPKLLQFLGNMVESYPDEWKGELIPELARARDEVPGKEGKRMIEGCLADITGYKYKNWEDYLRWHARWARVILIGREQKKDRIPDLLKYYQNTTKSVALKKSIIWALQQCKAKEALPLFLDDLGSSDPRVRHAAYSGFKSFFVDYPPPFDPAATDAVRAKQVAAIREWYAQKEPGAAPPAGG